MGKTRVFEALFKVDEKGVPTVVNKGLMIKFFEQYQDRTFSCEIRLLSNNKSEGLRGYYFAEIVPKFQFALRGCGYDFTKNETHDFIKKLTKTGVREVEIKGKIHTVPRSFKDADWTNADMLEYCEELKRVAAEEFSIIVNDPEPNQ